MMQEMLLEEAFGLNMQHVALVEGRVKGGSSDLPAQLGSVAAA